MSARRRIRASAVIVGAGLAYLTVAAGALAGTTTVTVKDKDKNVPACSDIQKVVAAAGSQTTTFTISMVGRVKASPCHGGTEPEVILNNRCNASGSPSSASVACEGGGGGPAKMKIDPSNSHAWVLSFKTKEAELKGTKSFKFQVSIAEGSDSAGPGTVKIG